MRFILLLLAAAAFAADPPPKLSETQRAEIALAIAQYQQARAEAAEAKIREHDARRAVEAMIARQHKPGWQLNDALVYVPVKTVEEKK